MARAPRRAAGGRGPRRVRRGRATRHSATTIAESSLTVDGVRCVVDSGLRRSSSYDPATGMSALVTGAVSAVGGQRVGRAGGSRRGWPIGCGRRASTRGRARHTPPEIETADLAPLVQLAAWGTHRMARSVGCRGSPPPPVALEGGPWYSWACWRGRGTRAHHAARRGRQSAAHPPALVTCF